MSVPVWGDQISVALGKVVLRRMYGPRFIVRVQWSETGCWIWKGAAGGKCNTPYGSFNHGHGQYPAHRLAWEAFYGPLKPKMQIDHRDHCNTLCVRPDHLRPATGHQNQQNRKGAPVTSTTGVRGVSRSGSRYSTLVQTRGKRYSAGTFDTLEEAEQAVMALRDQIFGPEWAGGSR